MKNSKTEIEILGNILAKSVHNTHAVTDKNGVSIGPKKTFFSSAQEASRKNKVVTDKNILWKPIISDGKTLGAIGVKYNKNIKEQEILIDGIVDEYDYEIFLKEQSGKYFDPKSLFAKELLTTNKIKNLDQAIDKADILGLNLRSQQAILVIKVPGLFKKYYKKSKERNKVLADIYMNKECGSLIEALKIGFKNYEQNIFACLGPDTFVAFKWARGQINTLNTISFYRKKAEYISDIIKKKTGITPTIGVGQYYPGLSGLKKSYTDAQTALDLGSKIWGEGKIYHITDVGMFVALSQNISIERKCELAHQIIGKLLKDKDLYKTVSVFFDSDMNLTDASKNLHLHRNTLIYRLEKIKKETGLDPRKFSDATQIKLGILLYGPRTNKCQTTSP